MFEQETRDPKEKELDEVFAKLTEQFGIDVRKTNLREQLVNVQDAFGSLKNVAGKRILDLGCGFKIDSKDPRDAYSAPWLCRALQALGAEAVGVDVVDLDGESFEHHRLDITKDGALSIFPDHSFDGINMMYVPYTMFAKNELEEVELRFKLRTEINRLLKEDGKYIKIML